MTIGALLTGADQWCAPGSWRTRRSCRSRSHPAQVVRRSQGAVELAGIAKLERSGSTRPKRLHLLRGRVRCEDCGRDVQGGEVRSHAYYRCRTRTLAPGSSVLAEHPKTVNLPEDVITSAINGGVGSGSCSRRTSRMRPSTRWSPPRAAPAQLAVDEAARRRLSEAQTALKRYRSGHRRGHRAAAVVDAINQARAEWDTARTRLAQTPDQPSLLDAAEVYAMVDALGEVGSAI